MITLKLDNKEASFKFNSSMRLKDFASLNELSAEIAAQAFELCQQAHKKSLFSAIDLSMVEKIKEEVVKKKGTFTKKMTATAFGKLNASDSHLMDAYIDKANKRHAKVVEEAIIWKATAEGKSQDAAQTNALAVETKK